MRWLAVAALASGVVVLALTLDRPSADSARPREIPVWPSSTRPTDLVKPDQDRDDVEPSTGRVRFGQVRWRHSTSVGLPWDGRLVAGVELPPEGAHFFTWDPLLRRKPNRTCRRYASDQVVRVVLRIASEFARTHPDAPRLAVGDLSQRGGGRFGKLHVSHQNGLDVDVYYPRRDRRELPPRLVADVDRRLAQDLVDRFVAAGATKVFVGPRLALRGPADIVQPLWNHDLHLHARFGNPR